MKVDGTGRSLDLELLHFFSAQQTSPSDAEEDAAIAESLDSFGCPLKNKGPRAFFVSHRVDDVAAHRQRHARLEVVDATQGTRIHARRIEPRTHKWNVGERHLEHGLLDQYILEAALLAGRALIPG